MTGAHDDEVISISDDVSKVSEGYDTKAGVSSISSVTDYELPSRLGDDEALLLLGPGGESTAKRTRLSTSHMSEGGTVSTSAGESLKASELRKPKFDSHQSVRSNES